HCPLGFGEQFVAPIKRGPQGLMPPQCRTAPSREEVKSIVESGSELLQPEGRGAGRRQFQGERDAIETSTDCPYDLGSLPGGLEAGIGRPGPRDEQSHRAVSQHVLQSRRVLARNGEWEHRIETLALRSQRLAA